MMTRKSMKWAAVFAMAVLLLGAPAAMAQSAVVDNGSNPQSRLNMRVQPDKNSTSLGRFYSGTPVEIITDLGSGWAQVAIGTADSAVGGYMMTDYLSAAGAAGVTDATFEMRVVSPYGTQSVVLRDRPSNSYDAVTMLAVGDTVRVLGDSGEYYYVLTRDDDVGCLCGDELK